MPEAVAFRCDLQTSRLAGRACAFARALTAAAAAACVVALLLVPSAARAVAALASVGALVYVFRPRRSWAPAALSVGADGAVLASVGDADVPVAVGYCGPRFMCFVSTHGSLAVWPDSLATASWRRLLVAGRWPHARPGGGEPRSASRTK